MSDILSLVGKTPLVELKKLVSPGMARILVKLEYLNPTGSHKDRIAVYMIKDAINRGLLKPGGTVVEASSGNTAISVTWVARLMGYNAVIVLPEGTSPSKVQLLKLLGAEVVFGKRYPPTSPDYYKNLARRIAEERGGVFLNQFENKANVRAHYETTGPEIWEQTKGSVDAFVMGVGTAGTIMGVGRYLKEKKPSVKLVAVTPRGSPLAGGIIGEEIEGLVSVEKPKLLDESLVDEVIEVSLSEAVECCKKLAREEGILAGLSTGANIVASLKVAKELGEKCTVVTIAADSIFRYLHILTSKP